MKIVIDGRMYSQSGIGRYIRNLVNNLQIRDRINEYYILLLKEDYDKLVYHSRNFNKILADFRWYGVYEQIKLPKLINKIGSDLVHFPHFNVPIFYGSNFVVTIHDLIHQQFQMRKTTTLDPLTFEIKKIGYNQVFKKAVTNSLKILAPSKYVKDLLIKTWEIDPEKIVVTYEAVDDKLFTIVNKMKRLESSRMLKKFGIAHPFIFYVGNAHPHKNIEGLIRAFLLLKEKYKDLKLVLSGHDNYFWQKIKSEHKHADIIYTGMVTDEELVALYKNAEAFVMPSFEEGFGITILEAMSASCPVVSSDKGALKEVGGDAAIYFDPYDLGDMGNKIDVVLKSEKLVKELTEKGKKRVKDFSWEKLAKQTLEVYQECV